MLGKTKFLVGEASLNSSARWSNAAYVLNEVKNPVRTLKIAGPLGLSICGFLYIFANISYFASGTPAQVEASGTTVAAHFMGRVFGLAGQRALRFVHLLTRMLFLNGSLQKNGEF